MRLIPGLEANVSRATASWVGSLSEISSTCVLHERLIQTDGLTPSSHPEWIRKGTTSAGTPPIAPADRKCLDEKVADEKRIQKNYSTQS